MDINKIDLWGAEGAEAYVRGPFEHLSEGSKEKLVWAGSDEFEKFSSVEEGLWYARALRYLEEAYGPGVLEALEENLEDG